MISQDINVHVAKAEPLPSMERAVPSGIPLRGPLASLLLHCALAFAWIAIAPWIPFVTRRALDPVRFDPAKYAGTIVYFRNGLPEISDQGGAQPGKSGPAGRDSFHAKQTIHIAHGSVIVSAVADAPELALPLVDAPANLVLFAHSVPIGPSPTVTKPASSAPQLPAPGVVPPSPPITPARLAQQVSIPEPGVVPPPPEMRTIAHPQPESPVAEAIPPMPAIPGSNRQTPAPLIPNPTALRPVPPVSNASGDANSRGQAAASGSTASVPTTPDGKHIAVIIAAIPGVQVGSGTNVSGALALSPAGTTDAAGGRGHGTGPGAGSGREAMTTGSGSVAAGSGFGSDSSAHAGISPEHGVGGAGTGSSPAPNLSAGVMIRDGQYYIPSFASPPAPVPPGKAPSWAPGRMASVVVVTTSDLGTALDSSLRGHRIYTLYLDTRIGEVVLQYADTTPQGGHFGRDLTPPAPIATDLPPDLRISGHHRQLPPGPGGEAAQPSSGQDLHSRSHASVIRHPAGVAL